MSIGRTFPNQRANAGPDQSELFIQIFLGKVRPSRTPRRGPSTGSDHCSNLLGDSRPTLIKRIESGELPSTMVGSHHRLRTNDVLALRRMRLEQRRSAALELLDLEDKLGL
ncbi:MAG: hypothetical protein GYA85_13720 [Propionibacterium sp.]|nr:hypothetical protein [Propionibacterium sp.]